MTKRELIVRLTELNDIESKAAAGRVLDYLIDTITAEVTAGNEVALGQNFGKFVPSTQAARSGVNAMTGKPFDSPAKQVIKFKPSAALKRAIAK